MRTIIAGSRTLGIAEVNAAMSVCPWRPSAILSGGAGGVDTAGAGWAWFLEIPVETYPADWKKFGRRAGPMRNEEMARHAEALVAVWDGKSKGTAHMIETAKKYRLRVFVWTKERP